MLNEEYRLAEWIHKQTPYICCLQNPTSDPKDSCRLKVRKYMEKYIPCDWCIDSFSIVVILWGLWLLRTMQTNLTLIVLKEYLMLCCLQHLCAQIWIFLTTGNSVLYEHIFWKIPPYFVCSSKTPTHLSSILSRYIFLIAFLYQTLMSYLLNLGCA